MATATKVRIKKIELANSTISTTYGRFKFDSNGTVRVPIELARELLASEAGFVVIDDSGNVIELPDDGDETLPGGDETLEPEPVIYDLPNGGTYTTIDGGYILNGNENQFTLVGSSIDSEHIFVKDDKVGFTPGVDTQSVHVIGVEENSTLKIGEVDYKWSNLDENIDNGLELVTISGGTETLEPEPTLPGGDETLPGGGDETLEPEPVIYDLPNGGTYTTIDGGYVISGETSKFTLIGDTLDESNIFVQDNQLKFNEGINPATIHVIGVEKDSTIEVGNKIYKYDNADNISANGMELVLVADNDTVEPEPTIPGGGDDTIDSGDTINSFSYDFDGAKFTVSGGLTENLNVSDLNEKATFDGEKLTLEDGIVSDLNEVHVQGLSENSSINVEGEEFVLQDTDDNPENGLELVGKTSDVYGWKFVNRSSANYESQIWKHSTDGVEDIVVVGCTARPSINNDTLTVLGEDIKVISNESRDQIIIDSELITGMLTKGVTWDSESGIKTGLGTKSYVLTKNILYVPKAFITNVTSSIIEWELSKGILTIINGTLEVSKTIVKGSSVSSIKYQNKIYYVNVKTGKLVANAWQKRK